MTRHPEPSAPLWQSGFKTLFSALFHCQSALCYYRNPCAKTFGERCTLEGFPEGVLSPNAAKSASLVTNVPCKPLYEGYFHQTILNNCHEDTKRHHNRASPPITAITYCHHCRRNPLPTTPFDFATTLSLPASVVRYFLM